MPSARKRKNSARVNWKKWSFKLWKKVCRKRWKWRWMNWRKIGYKKLRKSALWNPKGKTQGDHDAGFRFFCFLLLDVSRTAEATVFRNRNPISWGSRPRLFASGTTKKIFPEWYPRRPVSPRWVPPAHTQWGQRAGSPTVHRFCQG